MAFFRGGRKTGQFLRRGDMSALLIFDFLGGKF